MKQGHNNQPKTGGCAGGEEDGEGFQGGTTLPCQLERGRRKRSALLSHDAQCHGTNLETPAPKTTGEPDHVSYTKIVEPRIKKDYY